MILATIGHECFKLERLEQATQLLEILSTAKQVDKTYLVTKREHIIHETGFSQDVRIEILKENEILSSEEGRKLINEDISQRNKDGG